MYNCSDQKTQSLKLPRSTHPIVKYIISPVSTQPKIIPVSSGLPMKVASPHKAVVVKTMVSTSGICLTSSAQKFSSPVAVTSTSSSSSRCVLSAAVSTTAPSLKISLPTLANRGNGNVHSGSVISVSETNNVGASSGQVSCTGVLSNTDNGQVISINNEIKQNRKNGSQCRFIAKKTDNNFILKVAASSNGTGNGRHPHEKDYKEEEEDEKEKKDSMDGHFSREYFEQEQKQHSALVSNHHQLIRGEAIVEEGKDGLQLDNGSKRSHELTWDCCDSKENALLVSSCLSNDPERSATAAKRSRLLFSTSSLSLADVRSGGYDWNPRNRHFSHQHNIRPYSFLEDLCEVGDMYGIEEVKTTNRGAGLSSVEIMGGYALVELESDWRSLSLLSSQLEMWEEIELMNRDQLLKLLELKDHVTAISAYTSTTSNSSHQHQLMQKLNHTSNEGGANHNSGVGQPTSNSFITPATEGASCFGIGVSSSRRSKTTVDTLKKLVAKNDDLIAIIEDISTELSKVDSLKQSFLSAVDQNSIT